MQQGKISHTNILDGFPNITFKLLHSGGLGVVYKINCLNERNKITRRMVLKCITIGESDQENQHENDDIKAAKNEYKLLEKLSERTNVVQPIKCAFSQNKEYFEILMEYWGKSLSHYKFNANSAQTLVSWAKQTINILAASESMGVYHGDIKPANILLLKGVIKIADFGVSKFLSQTKLAKESGTLVTKIRGSTPIYLPPEILRKKPPFIMNKIDVYCFGMTFYELISVKRARALELQKEMKMKSTINYKEFLNHVKSLKFKVDDQNGLHARKFLPILVRTLNVQPQRRPPFCLLKQIMDYYDQLTPEQIETILSGKEKIEKLELQLKKPEGDNAIEMINTFYPIIEEEKEKEKETELPISQKEQDYSSEKFLWQPFYTEIFHFNQKNKTIFRFNFDTEMIEKTYRFDKERSKGCIHKYSITIATPNKKVFQVGGVNKKESDVMMPNVYEFLFREKDKRFSFQEKCNMKEGRIYFGNVADSQGNLFVLGGYIYNYFYTANCESYSSKDNLWKKIPMLNEEKAEVAACFYDKFIYVFGGRKEKLNPIVFSKYSKTVEKLNREENQKWEVVLQLKKNCPYLGSAGSGCCHVVNDTILLFGGKTKTHILHEGTRGNNVCNSENVYKFKADTKEFSQMKSELGFCSSFATCLSRRKKIFACPDVDFEDSARMFIYDKTSNNWEMRIFLFSSQSQYTSL